MSNELIAKENQPLSKFEQIQNQINQLMQEQVLELAKSNLELKHELEEYKELSEQNRELELKNHRVKEHRWGYVSLSDLGQMFTVSIGSKTMGKLLRMVGIAKNKQSKTEPYRQYIVNKYAKSEMYGEYTNYRWNPEKCISRIEDWLNQEGHLENFYSIDDENKLMQFINELSDRYE